MQKRHFEAIAKVINSLEFGHLSESAATLARKEVALQFAEGLYLQNPRFDRTRFLMACGF